jgi:hypothetical protein
MVECALDRVMRMFNETKGEPRLDNVVLLDLGEHTCPCGVVFKVTQKVVDRKRADLDIVITSGKCPRKGVHAL